MYAFHVPLAARNSSHSGTKDLRRVFLVGDIGNKISAICIVCKVQTQLSHSCCPNNSHGNLTSLEGKPIVRVQEACTLLVLSSGYRQPLTLLQGPGTQLNTLKNPHENPHENRHEPKFEKETCTNFLSHEFFSFSF